MKAYRVGWMVVCAAICVVGVGVVFVLSSAALLFLFLSFAIVGSILTPAVAGPSGTGLHGSEPVFSSPAQWSRGRWPVRSSASRSSSVRVWSRSSLSARRAHRPP
jgi:hypothetical protein